jgi:hypothetical protein
MYGGAYRTNNSFNFDSRVVDLTWGVLNSADHTQTWITYVTTSMYLRLMSSGYRRIVLEYLLNDMNDGWVTVGT